MGGRRAWPVSWQLYLIACFVSLLQVSRGQYSVRVTALSPDPSIAGTSTVTIHGSNFGTGGMQVRLGNYNVSDVTRLSATQAKFQVPTGENSNGMIIKKHAGYPNGVGYFVQASREDGETDGVIFFSSMDNDQVKIIDDSLRGNEPDMTEQYGTAVTKKQMCDCISGRCRRFNEASLLAQATNSGEHLRIVHTQAQISASVWVYPEDKLADQVLLFQGKKHDNCVWSLQLVDVGNEFRLRSRGKTAGATFDCIVDSGTANLVQNQWYHVSATIDAPGGEVKLYVDGTLAKTCTFSTGATMTTVCGAGIDGFTVGAAMNDKCQDDGGTGDALQFKGQLDEIVIIAGRLEPYPESFLLAYDVPDAAIASVSPWNMGYPAGGYTVTFTGTNFAKWSTLTFSSVSVAGVACTTSSEVSTGNFECAVPAVTLSTLNSQVGGVDVKIDFTSAAGTLPGCPSHVFTSAFEMWGTCGDAFKQLPEECDFAAGQGDISGCLSDCTVDASPVSSVVGCSDPSLLCTCTGATTSITESAILTGDQGGQWRGETNPRCTSNNQECNANKMVTGNGWWVDFWPQPEDQSFSLYSSSRVVCPNQHQDDQQLRNLFKDAVTSSKTDQWASEGDDCDISESAGNTGDWDRTVANLWADTGNSVKYDFNSYDNGDNTDALNTVLISINFNTIYRVKQFYLDSTTDHASGGGPQDHRMYYTIESNGYGTGIGDYLSNHQSKWVALDDGKRPDEIKSYYVGGQYGVSAAQVLIQVGSMKDMGLKRFYLEVYDSCTDSGTTADCKAGNPSACTRTYNNPTVTGVSPNSGDFVGGTTVTIQGTNFGEGFAAEAPVGYLGTYQCASTVYLDPSNMRCVTPQFYNTGAVTAKVDMTGVSKQATSAGNEFTISDGAPTISSLNPSSMGCHARDVITVGGTNFKTVTWNSNSYTLLPYTIGGTRVPYAERDSNTQLWLTPAAGVGKDHDAVFMYLKAGASVDVIPWSATSFWKWEQDGTDYWTPTNRAWMDPTSGWTDTWNGPRTAPITEGSGISNSIYHLYIRGTFNNPGNFEVTGVQAYWDDGVTVFMNGNYWFQKGSCVATCDHNVKANCCQDNQQTDGDILTSFKPSWLRTGTNVLAAAMSQADGSSDYTFDFRLTGRFWDTDTLAVSHTLVDAFSYDLPSITARTPVSGFDEGGYSITLEGACFGHINHASTTVTIDGNGCSSYTWISDSNIECIVPSGTGANKDIRATVASQTSPIAGSAKFSYSGPAPTPTVTGTDPSNADTGGGNTVTILGTNFYAWSATGNSITVGGSACGSLEVLSTTHIKCNNHPAGVGSGITVTVQLGGKSGSNNVFYYSPPTIASGSPTSAPGAGGATVTFTGTQFGPASTTSPELWIDGRECTSPEVLTTTLVKCDVPIGAGDNLNITLCIAGSCVYNQNIWQYDDPVITSTNQVSPAGGILTISGSNFGHDASKVTARLIGPAVACTVTEVSNTNIVCTLPAGVGDGYSVAATVDTLTDLEMCIFSYAPPQVSAVYPGEGAPAGNTLVTITGLNFGTAASGAALVDIGGSTCTSPVVVNDTAVVCNTPAGMGAGISVQVQIENTASINLNYGTMYTLGTEAVGDPFSDAFDGNTGTKCRSSTGTAGDAAVGFNFCAPRKLTSFKYYISPAGEKWRASGALMEGTSNNFGSDTDLATLPAVVTEDVMNDIASSDTVTKYAAARYRTVVTWGRAYINELEFWGKMSLSGSATVWSYYPPEVTLADPVVGKPAGGFVLTISGNYFGPASTSLTVDLRGVGGNYSCTSPQIVHDSLIYCDVPPGLGVALDVDVTVAGQTNTPNTLYNYALPDLWDISPKNGLAAGGYTITIFGDNLGAGVNGYLDGSRCTATNPVSATEMHCIAPPGVGLFHKFHIAPKSDMNIPVNDSSILFFNYDPPTITSITGTPRKPAGGDTVTFNGQGFGPTGTYVEGFLNGTSCQSTNTLNDGAVECVLPAGVGVYILPSVNVSTQFGNSSIPIFTYDKPTVTSIDPDRHDASGGDITVTGTNFGTVTTVSQLGISVQGTACTSVAVISDTTALCTTPPGYGGSLDVRVTIATQENPSANTLFSYNIPTVTSVTPDNGNTMGGYPITLAGINYGPFGESTPSVTVDGQTCTYVSHTTTLIVCTAPNHAGKNLSVLATTNGPSVTALTSLSNALFSYDPPTVASVDPDTGVTGGSFTLTVTGTNFGPSGTASAAVLGTLACGSSTVIHDSELQCSVPAGSGMSLAVQVSIDTAGSLQSGTTAALFTYNAPTVASLSPDTGDADGGDVIQITGTNYGPPGTPVAASISGTACTTATITGDTTMDCTVPPGIGVLHDIQVTVPDLANKQVSAAAPGQDLFTYDRPLVTGVNPNEQPGSGGATITVLGKNFGTDTSTAVGITIGGTTCVNPTHLSDTEARCEIPLGFGAKINIETTVATQTSVTNDLWTYQRPIITKVTPDSGLAIGGFNITIDGANFGLPVPAAVPFLSPFVNNVSCTYQIHTDTQLICTVPAGVGNLLSVDIVLKGARNNVNQYFTYAPPNVTDANPRSGVTAGGDPFSVSGDNFGPPGTPAIVRIGSRTSTSCFSTSDVLVTCTGHADGSGTGHSVFLTVGGQTSSILSAFTYNSPTVGSLTPDKRKTNGGQFVTVTGTNFGPHDSGPGTPINIRLGGTDCTASVHLSDTEVRCTVPEGLGISKSIQVTVPTGSGNSQTSPSPSLFSYEEPIVTSVSPNEQPTAGSTWVTVQGTNFGPSGFTPVTMSIGGSACTSPSILSHELAKCQTPAGIGGGINVVISRSSQDNTGQGPSYAVWTYERPTVTNLDPDTTPAVGGVNITITGTQFGPIGTLPTASLGGTVCSNPLWISGTSMLCTVPAGVGINLVVTVTIGGNTNNPGARFTYAPPTVTLASLQTGLTFGGAVVTLTGTNFGVAGNSVVLKVGGIPCQNPTGNVLSDTQVKCIVPAGIGYNRDIFIDASGQDTTLSNAWTYIAPSVVSISPDNGGTSGGYMATITGTNFGPSGTFVAATLGGVNCLASTWLADNLVRCQVPAGAGGSKGATVVVGNGAPLGMEGRLAAKGNLFTYDPPGVVGLVPAALLSDTVGGLVFTVQGSNFGATAASPAQVMVGGTLCQTTTWLSDTELKCSAPFGAGFDRDIQVSLDGAASAVNPALRLTYQPPVVTGITPDNLDTVGGLVTITGNYFGPQDYRYGHFLTVHFDIETDMARTSGAGPFLDKAEVDTALQLNNWPAAATSYGGYFLDSRTLKIGVLNDPRAQVASAAFSTVTVECKNGQTVIRNHRGDASYACERQLGSTTYVSPVVNNPTPNAERYQEAPYIITMVAADPKVVPVTGPDPSDTITLTFNKPTNKPAVNNRANIFKWLKWTAGIGHAGSNYNGAWNAAGDVLTITIVNHVGHALTLGIVNCAIDDTDGAEYILDANELLDSQKGVSLCPELTGDWGGALGIPPVIPLHVSWYHSPANPMVYPNSTHFRIEDGIVFYSSGFHCGLGQLNCHSGNLETMNSDTTVSVWDGVSTWETNYNLLPADALGDPTRVINMNNVWNGLYATGTNPFRRVIFRTTVQDATHWVETDGMKLITPSFAPYKLRSLLVRYDPSWVGASTGTVSPNELPMVQFHDIRYTRPIPTMPPVCVDAVADGANAITFTFDIATNKVAQAPGALSQAAVDAGLEVYASGAMGGVYTGHWVDPQTFRVTWPGGIGGSFTIGDTIFAFKPAMTIQNPSDTFSVSTNTRCPHLNGTLPSSAGARIVSVLAQGATNAAAKDGLSEGDTLRITFETAMVFPPAPLPSTKAAIDQMFTFSESLGTDYSGVWSADQKTLTITCLETTGNGNPTIGTFTISPKGPATNWVPTINLGSYPRVHGDFGTTAKRPQPHLLDFDHYNSTCTGSCYTDTPPAYIEGTLCPEAFWVNDDMIICMLPQGTGPYHNISVDINGQLSTSTNNNMLFTYNAPILYDHEPKGGFTDGTSNITITGTNFGFEDALDRILVGGSQCSVSAWINNTAVICQLPVGSGTGIEVRVQVNKQLDTSAGNTMFTYDLPIVYDIVPDHGKTINLLPPDPDTSDLADPYLVTIVGRNFGPPDGVQTYNVSIGDIICLNHTHINDTAVTCYPRGGVGVHKFPKVQFNGQENVRNTTWKYFTYDRPIVTRVSPNSGRKKGGAIITIYGENFGEFYNEVTVEIAGVQCEDPLWLSNYEMTCVTGKLAVFTIGTGSAGSSTQVYVGTQTNDPNSYFAYLDFTDPVCRHPAVEEYEPAIKVRQQLPDIPRYFNSISSRAYNITTYNGGAVNFPSELGDNDRCCKKAGETGGVCGVEFAPPVNVSAPNIVEVVLDLGSVAHLTGIYTSWFQPCQNEPNPFYDVDYWDSSLPGWVPLFKHVTLSSDSPCDTIAGDIGPTSLCVDYFSPIETTQVRMTFDNQKLYPAGTGFMTEFEAHGIFLHDPLYLRPVIPPDEYTQLSNFNVSWNLTCKTDNVNFLHLGPTDVMTQTVKVQLLAEDVPSLPKGTIIPLIGNITINPTEVPFVNKSTNRATGWTEFSGISTYAPKEGLYRFVFEAEPPLDFRADLAQPPSPLNRDFLVRIVPGAPTQLLVNFIGNATLMSAPQTPLPHLEVIAADPAGNPVLISNWTYGAVTPSSNLVPIIAPSGQHPLILGITTYTDLALERPRRGTHILTFTSNSTLGTVDVSLEIKPGLPDSVRVIDPLSKYREYNSNLVTPLGFIKVELLDAGGDPTPNDQLRDFVVFNVNPSDPPLTGTLSVPSSNSQVTFSDLSLLNPPKQNWTIQFSVSTAAGSGILLSAGNFTAGILIGVPIRPLYDVDPTPYRAKFQTLLQNYTVYSVDAGDNRVLGADTFVRTCTVAINSTTHTLQGTTSKSMTNGVTYFDDLYIAGPPSGRYFITTSCTGLFSDIMTYVDVIPGDPVRLSVLSYNVNSTYYADYRNDITPVVIQALDAGDNFAPDWGWNGTLVKVTSNTTSVGGILNNTLSAGLTDFNNITFLQPLSIVHTVKFDAVGLEPGFLLVHVDVGVAVGLIVYTPTDIPPVYPTQVRHHLSDFNVTLSTVDIRAIDAGGNQAIVLTSTLVSASSNTTLLYDLTTGTIPSSQGITLFPKLTLHRPVVGNHTIRFSAPNLAHVDLVVEINVGQAYSLSVLFWNSTIEYPSTFLNWLALIRVGAVDPGHNFAPATPARTIRVSIDGNTVQTQGLTTGTLIGGDIDFGLIYGQEHLTPYGQYLAANLTGTNATVPALTEGEVQRLGLITPKAQAHTIRFSAVGLEDATLSVLVTVGPAVKLQIPPHLRDTVKYPSVRMSNLGPQEVWAMDAGENHAAGDGNIRVSVAPVGQTSQGRPVKFDFFLGTRVLAMVNGTAVFTDLVLVSPSQGFHRFHYESLAYPWAPYDYDIEYVIGPALSISIPTPSAVIQTLPAASKTDILDILIAAEDAGGSLLGPLDTVNRTISVSQRTSTYTLTGTYDKLMHRGVTTYSDLAFRFPSRGTYYMDFSTPGLIGCNVTVTIVPGKPYRVVFSQQPTLPSSKSSNEVVIDGKLLNVVLYDASDEFVPMDKNRIAGFCIRPVTNSTNGTNPDISHASMCESGTNALRMVEGQVTENVAEGDEILFPNIRLVRPTRGWYHIVFYSVETTLLVPLWLPLVITTGVPQQLEATDIYGGPVKLQYKAKEDVVFDTFIIYTLDAAGSRVLDEDTVPFRNMTIGLVRPFAPLNIIGMDIGEVPESDSTNSTSGESILYHQGTSIQEVYGGKKEYIMGTIGFIRPPITLSTAPHTILFSIPNFESSLQLDFVITKGDMAKLMFKKESPKSRPPERHETNPLENPTGKLQQQPVVVITDELYNELPITGLSLIWSVVPVDKSLDRPPYLDLSPPVSDNGELVYTGLEMTGVRSQVYTMTWSHPKLRTLSWNVTIMVCEESKPFSQVGSDGIECECSPGYTDDGKGGCTPCLDGEYKDTPGVAPCLKCPENMNTLFQKASTSRRACQCISGYYDELFAQNYNQTASCTVCPEGANCPGGKVIEQIPGYWRSSNSSDKFYKCVGQACLGGQQECAAGHQGPLCDVCESGHGKFGTTCEPCPEAQYSMLIFLITAALLIAHMLLVIRTANSDRSKTAVMQKILLNYLQVLSLVGGFAVEWPPALRGMFQASEGTSSVSFRMISVECSTSMTVFQTFYAQIAFPAVFICCVFVFNILGYGIRKIIGVLKGTASMESIGDALRSCIVPTLVVIFMTHPTVSKEVFNMFNCVTLDEDGKEMRYLVIDLSETCVSPQYLSVKKVALVMLFTVCLGVPLYGFLLLRIIRDNLTKTSIVNKFGFMYIGLKPETYFWEMTIILRKIGIVACSVFLREDPQLQVYAAMWVMQASLVGHLYLNPYVNRTCHNLEFAALGAIFITLYCIIMYNNGGLGGIVINLVTYGLWLTNAGTASTLVFVFVKNKIAMKRAMKQNTITMGELKEVTTEVMDDVDAQEDLWNGMVEKDLGLKKVTDELFDDQGVRDDLWRSFHVEDGEADLVHISEQVMGNELKEVREEFLKTLYDDDDDTSEIVKAD